MDRIALFKGLYAEAVDAGFQDPFRALAPDPTQGAYEEWMVQSGWYKILFANKLFLNALDDFFHTKAIEVKKEGEDFQGYTRRVFAHIDPLEFFKDLYTSSIDAPVNFKPTIDQLTTALKKTLEADSVEITIPDDASKLSVKIADYEISTDISGDTKAEKYKNLTQALADVPNRVITDFARAGLKHSKDLQAKKAPGQ